ncbi:hypothetical protein GCM10009592_26430 [Brachybacterium rhamnosum]|uniref:Peptidoglycan-binding protein n=1 Tax=Brachybacterium rhamnosum TaxID=173361 RepID=A0ABW4PZD5_9MICO
MSSNRDAQIGRVVDVARAEVSKSSAEHPRGSNLTKYGKWYGVNGVAWCAMFVSWVMAQAGLDVGIYGPRTAWVPDYRVWARARGRWSAGKSDVRVGDIVTFRGGKHVELVIRVSGKRFWTVGGNTSWKGRGGSFADGVFVAENERTNDTVDGTLHPFYGVTDSMVRDAQAVVGVKVDGDLGPGTIAAVKAWQKANGLTADGIPGADTWQRMKGAPADTPAAPAKPAATKPAATKPAPAPAAAAKAPAFPLPRRKGAMFFYGPASGGKTSVSGTGLNTAVPADVYRDKNGRWHSRGLAKFQERLIARGWKELERDGADGRYGDTMAKVVKQFQKTVGQPQDGKVGPETWAAAWEAPVK